MMDIEMAKNYISGKKKINKPTRTRVSIHYEDDYRVKEAMKQAEMNPTNKEDVIRFTNEFLQLMGIKSVDNPEVKYPNAKLAYPDFYQKIQKDYELKDTRDIIWMKFTRDGYLGVVAVSNDINFDIPTAFYQYNYKFKGREDGWIYNTSGIIVHMLGKVWDESFVLVFPLCNKPDSFKRGDIERGVGNFLIDKGVPILDYYGHTF